MYLAIAYFCLILGCLIYAVKANRGLGLPGIVAFSVYMFSTCAMMVLIVLDNPVLKLVPTVYFAGMVLLFMLPHVSGKAIERQAHGETPWSGLHSFFAFLVMLPCYYSIVYSLPVALRNLGGPIESSRQAVYAGEIVGTGNFNASMASGFWPLALAFAFYAALSGRSLVFIACLVFASFSGAINGLASLGRSGMVYWVLFLLIWLSLTWSMIKVRMGDRIKYVKGGVTATVCLIIFAIVGLAYGRNLGLSTRDARTGLNSRESQMIYSLSSYTGQSIVNFQDFWQLKDDFGYNLHGQKIFPLYYGIMERLGIVDDYDAAEIGLIYKPIYDAFNLEHAVFNGFQRELIMDFGKVGALVAGVFYASLSLIARRRYEAEFTFSRLLFSSFMISVPVFGVFFFSYGEIWANVTIAGVVATCFVFAHVEKAGRIRKVGQIPLSDEAGLERPARLRG